MPELDLVVVFPTTHLTLAAEKALEKAGVALRTVMKPRKISSDCGLAIRIHAGSIDRAREALLAGGLLPVRFLKEGDGQWECVVHLEK